MNINWELMLLIATHGAFYVYGMMTQRLITSFKRGKESDCMAMFYGRMLTAKNEQIKALQRIARKLEEGRYLTEDEHDCCLETSTSSESTEDEFLGHSPAPTMVLYPSMDIAKQVSKDRIQPLFQDCPNLRKHKTDVDIPS